MAAYTVTGDEPVSKVTSKFVGKDLTYETKVNLDDSTSDINDTTISGKKAGSVVAYIDGEGARGIAISKGSDTDSGWEFISTLQVVAQADLTSAASELNTIGKYAGQMVIAVGATAGYAIYISAGATATSLWYLPTGTATGAITPS